MQANYPKKIPPTFWDPVRLNYPVRKFPDTGISSETIGRHWRNPPDVMLSLKTPIEMETLNYSRDYNVCNNLLQSQATVDYGLKISETERFNKHTSSRENLCIYPPHRKLADRPPALTAHSTSEIKTAFTSPNTPSRLVTNKDQFKQPISLSLEPPYRFHEDVEPLDTTYEGYEKYLDPYLTTNRLNHRPFTADQLCRASNSKDVVTYYTYANIPWVRSPKPNYQEWRLPLSKVKPVYDREKFKQGLREIRTHNALNWVPRSRKKHMHKPPPPPPGYTSTIYVHYHQNPRPKSQRLCDFGRGVYLLTMLRLRGETIVEFVIVNVYSACVSWWRWWRFVHVFFTTPACIRSFRTEISDNYVNQSSRPESRVQNLEGQVKAQYQRSLANLQTNIQQTAAIQHLYNTESAQIGSRKPLCSVLDQFVEKNRRLTK